MVYRFYKINRVNLSSHVQSLNPMLQIFENFFYGHEFPLVFNQTSFLVQEGKYIDTPYSQGIYTDTVPVELSLMK